VIVSAGAVQSPAILCRSGIGPGEVLQPLGIPVHVDAPATGRNLQDHCGLTISKFVNVRSAGAPPGEIRKSAPQPGS